jgi:hypothetical protein
MGEELRVLAGYVAVCRLGFGKKLERLREREDLVF